LEAGLEKQFSEEKVARAKLQHVADEAKSNIQRLKDELGKTNQKLRLQQNENDALQKDLDNARQKHQELVRLIELLKGQTEKLAKDAQKHKVLCASNPVAGYARRAAGR
jgi:hypothetical protein